MEPFAMNKRVLQWHCVYPLDENSSKWMKWACVAFALCVFASNILAIVSSAVYVWKYIWIDLEGSLYALFQVAGWTSLTYGMVIAFIMRKELTATIDQSSDIFKNM